MQNRQISIENIQKTVADYYKIKVAEMFPINDYSLKNTHAIYWQFPIIFLKQGLQGIV